MSDTSDDEESPNLGSIHANHATVDQAMVAYNFIQALQSGSASSTGLSTNIDAWCWSICLELLELIQKVQSPKDQVKRDQKFFEGIQMQPTMDEVSEPELCMVLNH